MPYVYMTTSRLSTCWVKEDRSVAEQCRDECSNDGEHVTKAATILAGSEPMLHETIIVQQIVDCKQV